MLIDRKHTRLNMFVRCCCAVFLAVLCFLPLSAQADQFLGTVYTSASGCCYPGKPSNQSFNVSGVSVQGCDAPASTGNWTVGAWGPCSAACGGGMQTRNVACNYTTCIGAEPAGSQMCNEQACSSPDRGCPSSQITAPMTCAAVSGNGSCGGLTDSQKCPRQDNVDQVWTFAGTITNDNGNSWQCLYNCATQPICTQSTESRTVSCPSGQTGAIQQSRTVDMGGRCGEYSDWYETSNTCVLDNGGGGGCPDVDTKETRVLPCPTTPERYVGNGIFQERTIHCGVPASWITTSEQCALASASEGRCNTDTVGGCARGNSYNLTGNSTTGWTWMCSGVDPGADSVSCSKGATCSNYTIDDMECTWSGCQGMTDADRCTPMDGYSVAVTNFQNAAQCSDEFDKNCQRWSCQYTCQ